MTTPTGLDITQRQHYTLAAGLRGPDVGAPLVPTYVTAALKTMFTARLRALLGLRPGALAVRDYTYLELRSRPGVCPTTWTSDLERGICALTWLATHPQEGWAALSHYLGHVDAALRVVEQMVDLPTAERAEALALADLARAVLDLLKNPEREATRVRKSWLTMFGIQEESDERSKIL